MLTAKISIKHYLPQSRSITPSKEYTKIGRQHKRRLTRFRQGDVLCATEELLTYTREIQILYQVKGFCFIANAAISGCDGITHTFRKILHVKCQPRASTTSLFRNVHDSGLKHPSKFRDGTTLAYRGYCYQFRLEEHIPSFSGIGVYA